MPKVLVSLLIVIIPLSCQSQSISGRVVNDATMETLSFVSIGIIGTNSGTITNEKGYFKLDVRGFSPEAKIRISMIGFEAQIIQLKNLTIGDGTIKLKEHSIQLSEVIIKPQKIKRKTIGTKSSSTKMVTGWGGCGNCGEDLGGIERGIRIDLSAPVFVEKVNFFVAYFGYDSMLLRLHIRKIENDHPSNELLNTNIYVHLKSTGWHEVDLRKYDLSFSDDIAVSNEWVKAWGKIKDRENSLKLSVALLKGTLFSKDANEGQWSVHKHVSPGIYLTVQEL